MRLRTCTCVMPTPAIPTHGVVAGGTLEHTARRGTSPHLSQTSAGVHFPTYLPPHALCVNVCWYSLQVAALLCSLASSVPGRRLLDSRFTLDACLGLLSLTLLRLSDSMPSAPEPVKGVSTHANLLDLLALVFGSIAFAAAAAAAAPDSSCPPEPRGCAFHRCLSQERQVVTDNTQARCV